MHPRPVRALLGLAVCVGLWACTRPVPEDAPAPIAPASAGAGIVSIPLGGADDTVGLDAIVRAIGSRRIVLLGENGHGVGDFSTLKARIVRLLHARLGFDVVAFESGYHDCREADARLLSQSVTKSFRDCLNYQLEHPEALPLFEYAREVRQSGHPLTIAGLDYQTQGATTRTRPAYLREALGSAVPALAAAVADADTALIAGAMAGGDTLRAWLRASGREALAVLDSALRHTTGEVRWTIAASQGLLRRLLVRHDAEGRGESTPAEYYGLRDEWMARTIAWLADSTGRPRRVVAWLHNDHARLGDLTTPAGPIAATGRLLRRQYGSDIYAIGLFMGHGTVTDNSRRPRTIAPLPPDGIESLFERRGLPAAFLELAPASGAVRVWADSVRPYLRAGVTVDTMRPGREFDALLYVSRVSPPSYRLP